MTTFIVRLTWPRPRLERNRLYDVEVPLLREVRRFAWARKGASVSRQIGDGYFQVTVKTPEPTPPAALAAHLQAFLERHSLPGVLNLRVEEEEEEEE